MIQLEEIHKEHRRGETLVPALRGVSCTFPTGSFTFILGPSGSGKSSLLYLIGGLDEPSRGKVLIDGRCLAEFPNRERDQYRRQSVGFVFQNFNLLGNLDALGNVLVPFLPVGIDEEMRHEAIRLLNEVGLSDRIHHRPHQLSGGEQQRIAIARALLKKPRLVLADEPTGELDSATGAGVFECLRKLHEELGNTVVVVTHDERYIQDKDRILRIRDGHMEDTLDS